MAKLDKTIEAMAKVISGYPDGTPPKIQHLWLAQEVLDAALAQGEIAIKEIENE